MVKMANIVPLIIYLLIYIFSFFFFRQLKRAGKEMEEAKKYLFVNSEVKKKKVALWVRVTKFHKLATTEAFLSPPKQMKIQPPPLF